MRRLTRLGPCPSGATESACPLRCQLPAGGLLLRAVSAAKAGSGGTGQPLRTTAHASPCTCAKARRHLLHPPPNGDIALREAIQLQPLAQGDACSLGDGESGAAQAIYHALPPTFVARRGQFPCPDAAMGPAAGPKAGAGMTGPPLRPNFDYAAAPALFLGRQGRGPLTLVWDTNILVDYLQHGPAMWEGEALQIRDRDYLSDLGCLQLLVRTAFVRDVCIVLLHPSVAEAERRVTARGVAGRSAAAERFAQALTVLADDTGSDNDGPGVRQPAYRQVRDASWSSVREALPLGHCGLLVETAVAQGAHVFLTREPAVLARRESLLPFGLLLASPGDLLEELAVCGALLAALSPGHAQWPVPHQQRMSHVVQALRGDSR